MRTRTEIIVERDRWVVVNRRTRTVWCRDCSRQVEMLGIDDAAILARVSSRTIFQWAESGVVHSIETSDGLLLICAHSLSL
jgi:hypothetical protein